MRLQCRNLTFRYPRAERPVFRDLSCTIEGPGFHALFGPSGVGKTTFARMLAGDIGGFNGDITASDMGRVLYSYNLERLPGWSSVEEHLQEVTPAARQTEIPALVGSFGLESCVGSRFSRLSLGQQNRTILARYLLQDFDLLIMDESLANVDEVTREQIILKIKEKFPERCFLYISHNLVEVARFCRQILVLRSPLKEPQMVSVQGHDHTASRKVEEGELSRIMLEILDVS
jgi:ABC-type multidrug transport system ATPase subunit